MSERSTEKSLSVDIGFTYVLIIEWLAEEDEKTGRLLYNHLKQLEIPAVLVLCDSATHIREAIERATHRVPTHGYPIIHIESHGSPPETDLGMTLGSRNGVALEWADLGNWLAPLNIASDFRLLVLSGSVRSPVRRRTGRSGRGRRRRPSPRRTSS